MAYIIEQEDEPQNIRLTAGIFSVLLICGFIHFLSEWTALLSWRTFLNGLSYFLVLVFAFMNIGVYVYHKTGDSAKLKITGSQMNTFAKILIIPCMVIVLFTVDLIWYDKTSVTSQSTDVVGVVCGKKFNYGQVTHCFKVKNEGKVKIYHPALVGVKVGEHREVELKFRKSAFLPGVQYLQTN